MENQDERSDAIAELWDQDLSPQQVSEIFGRLKDIRPLSTQDIIDHLTFSLRFKDNIYRFMFYHRALAELMYREPERWARLVEGLL